MKTRDQVDGLPKVQSGALVDSSEGDASLTQRARRGAIWTGASTILLRLSNVLVMVIVARIVSPAELGLYALAIAIYGFVIYIAWGVVAVIARSDLDADKLGPTVTSLAMYSSFVIAGLMAWLARPLAAALGTPDAAPSIRILAIIVALAGIFAVPVAQNQRAFRQEVVFRANVISFFGSSAALLLLVITFKIPGAEAFAWSRVIGHLIVSLTIFLSLDKRYRPGWRAEYVVPLLRFGVPAALGGVLSQLVLNVDYVIIAHQMTTTDLGQYMLAFNVASWPTAVLGAILNAVVLPAFSGVRRDGGDLSATVARAVRVTGFSACPIAAFTCVFAHPLIETVYGGRWLEAAPVLSVLALYGVLYVIGLLFDNIMIASGKTFTMFAVQAAALLALVPALLVGVRLDGLVGVGVGHIVVVLLVTMPAYIIAIHRIVGAGVWTILRAFSRPALAAVAAAGVALLATKGISLPIGKLTVGGVVGLIVYLAIAGPQLLQFLPSRVAGKRIPVLLTTWPSLMVKQLRPATSR